MKLLRHAKLALLAALVGLSVSVPAHAEIDWGRLDLAGGIKVMKVSPTDSSGNPNDSSHPLYTQLGAGSAAIGTVQAQGTVASAGSATGVNPVFQGVLARTANPSAGGNNVIMSQLGTQVGAIIDKPYSIPELDWGSVAASSGIANTTTATTLIAAAGSGIRNYVTGCDLSTDTLGAATTIVIRDGAAGTVIWRQRLQTTALPVTHIPFTSPRKSTANTLLEVATETAVTGGVYINCRGYQAP